MSKAARRRNRKARNLNRSRSATCLSQSRQLHPGSLVTRIAQGTLTPNARRDPRLLLVLSVVRAPNCIPQYLCQFCDTGDERYFLPHQISPHDEELR